MVRCVIDLAKLFALSGADLIYFDARHPDTCDAHMITFERGSKQYITTFDDIAGAELAAVDARDHLA